MFLIWGLNFFHALTSTYFHNFDLNSCTVVLQFLLGPLTSCSWEWGTGTSYLLFGSHKFNYLNLSMLWDLTWVLPSLWVLPWVILHKMKFSFPTWTSIAPSTIKPSFGVYCLLLCGTSSRVVQHFVCMLKINFLWAGTVTTFPYPLCSLAEHMDMLQK